jgi:glc operon protein GlcG
VDKKWVLTNEDVQKIVAACKGEAAKRNLEATIAVCDAGGHLLYLERPHTHRPNGVEMSTGKARTSALRARPSSALEKRAAERSGFLMVPNCLPIRGGVPVFYEGEIVGGIGVSGIDVHDEAIAQAGADAIKT